MAKAFECDRCKTLVKTAETRDLFYRDGFRIEFQYFRRGFKIDGDGLKKVDWNDTDLCFECRKILIQEVIRGLEGKAKYSWEDLQNPRIANELIGHDA